MTPSKFRALVWRYYRVHGRHDLPWRKTLNLYKILVSEIMLQQTQVERVIPFYSSFIRKFPTAKKLAAAPLSDVVKTWQGLGYNRRAKMLHQAAKQLTATRFDLKNKTSRSKTSRSKTSRSNLEVVAELETLPGVGPYTARAVAAFALNKDVVFVETNIRTVIIHHFFTTKDASIYRSVSDSQIEKVLEHVLPKGKARDWYSALMDYGAHLKRAGISHNTRTRGYTKQSTFTGSLREARGAILRELTRGAAEAPRLFGLLGSTRRADIRTALAALLKEQLITKTGARYALAD